MQKWVPASSVKGLFKLSTEGGVRHTSDEITKLDDTTISSISDWRAVLPKYKLGDLVSLTVVRNGNSMKLSVTLD